MAYVRTDRPRLQQLGQEYAEWATPLAASTVKRYDCEALEGEGMQVGNTVRMVCVNAEDADDGCWLLELRGRCALIVSIKDGRAQLRGLSRPEDHDDEDQWYIKLTDLVPVYPVAYRLQQWRERGK